MYIKNYEIGCFQNVFLLFSHFLHKNSHLCINYFYFNRLNTRAAQSKIEPTNFFEWNRFWPKILKLK